MTEYDKQANDFLKLTSTTIQARWLRYAPYFCNDKVSRDVWQVKMVRGNREYVFEFGSSIKDHEDWRNEVANTGMPYINKDGIPHIREWPYGYPDRIEFEKAMNKAGQLEAEFTTVGLGHRPTAYDILSALTKYEPSDNVDDFAAESGYTKPSEIVRASLLLFNS